MKKITKSDVSAALNKKHKMLMAKESVPAAKIEIEIKKEDEDSGLAPDGSEEKMEHPEMMLANESEDGMSRDKILEDMINLHTDHVKPGSLEGRARALMKDEKGKLLKK